MLQLVANLLVCQLKGHHKLRLDLDFFFEKLDLVQVKRTSVQDPSVDFAVSVLKSHTDDVDDVFVFHCFKKK